MTSTEAPKIRTATPDDAAPILTLIRELAEYERLSHACVATLDDVRASLFCDRPHAEARIAELDGEPVGFAIFFHSYSTFLAKPGLYLEDLYVREASRGKGVGRALLQHLAVTALERGCGRFEWAVLDWNEPARKFYGTVGAQEQSDWIVCRLAGDALARFAKAR